MLMVGLTVTSMRFLRWLHRSAYILVISQRASGLMMVCDLSLTMMDGNNEGFLDRHPVRRGDLRRGVSFNVRARIR